MLSFPAFELTDRHAYIDSTMPDSEPTAAQPTLQLTPELRADIERAVRCALAEDIGDGDITAQLIPAEKIASATIITREPAILCGRPWVDEVFRQIDANVRLEWNVDDGAAVIPNQTLITLHG